MSPNTPLIFCSYCAKRYPGYNTSLPVRALFRVADGQVYCKGCSDVLVSQTEYKNLHAMVRRSLEKI